jgi:hypothetical protein
VVGCFFVAFPFAIYPFSPFDRRLVFSADSELAAPGQTDEPLQLCIAGMTRLTIVFHHYVKKNMLI